MSAGERQGATLHRLVIAVALLVLLAVMAAGPFNTNEQVRHARESAAAERAESAAELAAQRAQLDELLRLLEEQRVLIEQAAPVDQLADITARIALAVEAIQAGADRTPVTPAPATPTPAPAPSDRARPTPSPDAARPSTPAVEAAATPRPCAVRLLPVCIEGGTAP